MKTFYTKTKSLKI